MYRTGVGFIIETEGDCRNDSEYEAVQSRRHLASSDKPRVTAFPERQQVEATGNEIPGSFAELQALGDGQSQFLEWMGRNATLVERVAIGEVECCGEWRREGYHGWCSLLCRPRLGCPVANERLQEAHANAAWLSDLLTLIGDGNVINSGIGSRVSGQAAGTVCGGPNGQKREAGGSSQG